MELKPENKWECPTCSKTFKTKQHFTQHVVTHDPNAKVKCEVSSFYSKFVTVKLTL